MTKRKSKIIKVLSEIQREAINFNYCAFRMRGDCADLNALMRCRDYIDPETYEELVGHLHNASSIISEVLETVRLIQQSRIRARKFHPLRGGTK